MLRWVIVNGCLAIHARNLMNESNDLKDLSGVRMRQVNQGRYVGGKTSSQSSLPSFQLSSPDLNVAVRSHIDTLMRRLLLVLLLAAGARQTSILLDVIDCARLRLVTPC